ncbi:serine protease inhibitor 3/4-like [Aphomia sociella]
MVVSTLILRPPLCKLTTVADGQTKSELLSALGLSDENKLKYCYADFKDNLAILTDVDLLLLNKIYVNYTSYLEPSFISDSWGKYGVQVEKISFKYRQAAVSFINRWIDVGTYKRITDILNNNDIDVFTSMIVINAAHIKPTWEFPFNIKYTISKGFRLRNNTVINIPTMAKVDQALYYADTVNNMEMMSMHLGARGCSICFVVPNTADGLPALLDKLSKDPDIIVRNRNKMKWTHMKIRIPRFKIKFLVDWTEYLKKIGINNIFNKQSSGLDSITTDSIKNKMYLSKVKQKVFFELDEMGPHRQMNPDEDYDTKVMLPNSKVSDNLKYFAADRPFYFIVDMELGSSIEELFNGVYYGIE